MSALSAMSADVGRHGRPARADLSVGACGAGHGGGHGRVDPEGDRAACGGADDGRAARGLPPLAP
jgi:hypothetical protein